ncbi:MAG: hypothetical protein HETSPECPRED_006350 [Heterodermia speciosa]|uniref:Uncharacterized protein n=1 Tax=Heterodermia speciosa TaxID=116794 RepID=A0A8H3FJZ5_9LECA|nr:MAG: hypothetical protein HETSPECPRED_006350 [Heterodermia speciosa]
MLVQVLNVTVAAATVEDLLNLTSTAQHYAMTVWMNITVLVGYSVGLNSSAASGRRLLQHADTDLAALLVPQTHIHQDSMKHAQQQQQHTHMQRTLSPLLQQRQPQQDPNERALSLQHRQPHATRQLRSVFSYTWQSPLSLQLKLLEKAFLDTSVCNATLVAQQLGLNSSVSSLNCTNSTALTLLTNLLSAASSGTSPPLSVLMVADSPSSSQSTSPVDSNAGIEASVRSTINIMLQGYERQIAQILAMVIKELNTVNTLQTVVGIKATYIKKFITTAQKYITETTTYVNAALPLFGIKVSNSTSASASTYTQLVQTTLADNTEADNTLYASASFQAAVAALVPRCSRDALGNQRFYFSVADDQTQENVTANSTITASATTETAVLNETESNCPAALVSRNTGFCEGRWSGYPLVQASFSILNLNHNPCTLKLAWSGYPLVQASFSILNLNHNTLTLRLAWSGCSVVQVSAQQQSGMHERVRSPCNLYTPSKSGLQKLSPTWQRNAKAFDHVSGRSVMPSLTV